MGKKTDKMYMTATEWQQDFGGAKKAKLHSEFKKLPFSCCSLSFLPFTHPVCTPEGQVGGRCLVRSLICSRLSPG